MKSGDETGWLIERYDNSMLIYWSGRASEPRRAWTRKHDEALRFARFEDASTILAWLLEGNGRVVEHAWINRAAPTDGERIGSSSQPQTVTEQTNPQNTKDTQ